MASGGKNSIFVNCYFLHYNVKSQTPFMSSDIRINLNRKGKFYSGKE